MAFKGGISWHFMAFHGISWHFMAFGLETPWGFPWSLAFPWLFHRFSTRFNHGFSRRTLLSQVASTANGPWSPGFETQRNIGRIATRCVEYITATSSTAQGGGGSFKNRKPIGELGCCEWGMAERSHWWTERCLRSPLFLSLSLTIYLPTSLSSMYLSI